MLNNIRKSFEPQIAVDPEETLVKDMRRPEVAEAGDIILNVLSLAHAAEVVAEAERIIAAADQELADV